MRHVQLSKAKQSFTHGASKPEVNVGLPHPLLTNLKTWFGYLKRLLINQTVNQDETLAVFDVEISHGSKLLSSCGVQNFQHGGGRVHFDLFAVEIFNGGVIFLNESPSDKLHSQGGFANPSAP